jgi:hypothetical protein
MDNGRSVDRRHSGEKRSQVGVAFGQREFMIVDEILGCLSGQVKRVFKFDNPILVQPIPPRLEEYEGQGNEYEEYLQYNEVAQAYYDAGPTSRHNCSFRHSIGLSIGCFLEKLIGSAETIKKVGSGGGGMPDSDVRWLEFQHTPLPKSYNNPRSKQFSCNNDAESLAFELAK